MTDASGSKCGCATSPRTDIRSRRRGGRVNRWSVGVTVEQVARTVPKRLAPSRQQKHCGVRRVRPEGAGAGGLDVEGVEDRLFTDGGGTGRRG